MANGLFLIIFLANWCFPAVRRLESIGGKAGLADYKTFKIKIYMKKPKTLGDLLEALKMLTPEELKKPAIYNSENLCLSGIVTGFGPAKADFYWDGGDDPSQLKTKKEWKEYGYDADEIAEMEIEIRKGDFVINF
jgi:hypothetical protein